ncbi:MAG TPA: lipid-A-disaccharide synthase, partial [Rudaea sp.]
WAWREKRAQKIGRSADLVLCLFPMEPPIYARYGIDARFVGHPLARAFPLHSDRAAARRELALPANGPVLAVLPGSRLGEIHRLGRTFAQAAALVAREIPQSHIVAPMANAACRDAFAAIIADDPETAARFALIDGRAHTVMAAADAILLASGTAALEAMLAKRPMVVGYRVAPASYFIARLLRMLKTDVYSLPNILGGRRLVPELMQDACTAPALAQPLLAILRERSTNEQTVAEFERIHRDLLGDADHDAATAVADLITR